MNKWIYLISSCIFIFLIVITYPIIKESTNASNLLIFSLFIIGFFSSIYLFYKKSTHKNSIEKSIEKFTPVD